MEGTTIVPYQKWCGQTQPHNSHIWADIKSDSIGLNLQCAGYANQGHWGGCNSESDYSCSCPYKEGNDGTSMRIGRRYQINDAIDAFLYQHPEKADLNVSDNIKELARWLRNTFSCSLGLNLQCDCYGCKARKEDNDGNLCGHPGCYPNNCIWGMKEGNDGAQTASRSSPPGAP